MKTWALVVDTWREALARYTLLGFLIASTLFMLTVTFALNLDIVDGSLAAATLFGRELQLHGTTAIDEVVTGGLAAFAAMTYALGIFLAVFTTGSQVPNLMRRGTVDLYLSRPVSRTHVLLGRFLGATTLVLANLLYLCGGLFFIVSLKTGVWNPRFIAASCLIFVTFMSFLGFMYLVGVVSGSTPLSIMLPYAVYIVSMPLAAHDRIAAAMDSRLAADVVQGLYWTLPKTAELGRDMVRLVAGRGTPALSPLLTTAAFGAGCLVLATVVFRRKNF
jgi:ABC-2 type transport system permease protein